MIYVQFAADVAFVIMLTVLIVLARSILRDLRRPPHDELRERRNRRAEKRPELDP